MHETQEPTLDEHGAEVHPAFGMIAASRVSNTPGSVLFDSDIRHGHSVVLRIGPATRKRDLNHDWIHGGSKDLIEVEMSEAQWASFVSSMNTSGVPCTIRRTENDWNIPGLPYAPRMAESIDEVHAAAERTFTSIKEAMAAYEALPNTPAKAKNEALRTLHYAIENATSNVDFASKSLRSHAENVVQRARADIEAMVTNKAAQLGLTAAQVGEIAALPGGSDD